VVPSGVYTDPEIACVGITADDAKAKGIPVITGKYVMSGNAKTLMERTERSFIKVVFHAETDVLLGAQMMCPRATDMIAELSDAVVNGLTSRQLLSALRPHPTFVEAVTEAIEAAHGSAIHVMPSKR
jgi:dihydrolipoamide dehydrogenase